MVLTNLESRSNLFEHYYDMYAIATWIQTHRRWCEVMKAFQTILYITMKQKNIPTFSYLKYFPDFYMYEFINDNYIVWLFPFEVVFETGVGYKILYPTGGRKRLFNKKYLTYMYM